MSWALLSNAICRVQSPVLCWCCLSWKILLCIKQRKKSWAGTLQIVKQELSEYQYGLCLPTQRSQHELEQSLQAEGSCSQAASRFGLPIMSHRRELGPPQHGQSWSRCLWGASLAPHGLGEGWTTWQPAGTWEWVLRSWSQASTLMQKDKWQQPQLNPWRWTVSSSWTVWSWWLSVAALPVWAFFRRQNDYRTVGWHLSAESKGKLCANPNFQSAKLWRFTYLEWDENLYSYGEIGIKGV